MGSARSCAGLHRACPERGAWPRAALPRAARSRAVTCGPGMARRPGTDGIVSVTVMRDRRRLAHLRQERTATTSSCSGEVSQRFTAERDAPWPSARTQRSSARAVEARGQVTLGVDTRGRTVQVASREVADPAGYRRAPDSLKYSPSTLSIRSLGGKPALSSGDIPAHWRSRSVSPPDNSSSRVVCLARDPGRFDVDVRGVGEPDFAAAVGTDHVEVCVLVGAGVVDDRAAAR